MHKSKIQYLPDFYKRYIDLVETDNFLETLEQNHRITQELLKNISEEKSNFRYAEGKWSIKEVVLHLADTERIMTYRALHFARKDSIELPGFEQDDYVKYCKAEKRSLENIAKEFEVIRKSSIELFKNFDEEMLLENGIANQNRISVLAYPYIIIGHENHHRKIIQERYLPEIN